MKSVSAARYQTALLSIFGSGLILLVKWYAYRITGSAALKSDALEGIVNVAAALFALGALVYAEQPADEDHPYGHGKIEFFSAAFEGGLIAVAAFMIVYEAVKAFYLGAHVENLDKGLIINFMAGAANGLLGWMLVRQGRKLKSDAIIADGEHVISDFMTTIGVAVGLLLVRFTGLWWIDPLVALIVGVMLARTGFLLVTRSGDALLDSQDPKVLNEMIEKMNEIRTPEIIAAHKLRTMRSGRLTHAEMHIVVPEYLEVRKAHDLVEKFCEEVMKAAGLDGELQSHLDPCNRAYCTSCAVKACPIRAKDMVASSPITLNEAIQTDDMDTRRMK